MKKKIYAKLKDLYETLRALGYRQIKQCTMYNGTEWRRHQFHLIIKKKGKRGLTLNIHEDVPSSYPPFHRAVKKGKQLGKELNKILETYKTRRAAKI